MPIYEYVCTKCGARVEVLQKMSDAPMKRCKSCRGKLEKLISQTSFQLKGTGWYQTDYAAKPNGKSEKTEKSDPVSSAPPAPAPKSEPKPAANPDSKP